MIVTDLYTYTHMCILKRFDFNLDEKLAVRFRRVASEKGGYKRGSITQALTEAILAWLKKNSHSKLTKNSQNRGRRRLKE